MNRRWSLASLAAPALLALVGCQNADLTNAAGNSGAAFSQNISPSDLDSTLITGTARVTIRVRKDSLVARRIIVRRASQLTRPERVDAGVTAVASGTAADTLVLGGLGGLKIVVNDSTRFRGEADEDHDWMDDAHFFGFSGSGPAFDDGDHDTVTTESRAAFIMEVQTRLAAGRRVTVVAERPAPTSPQAPGDGSFVAARVHLDDGDEAAEISVNVDSANVSAGFITVLGLKIAITSDTRISSDLPPTEGAMAFGGAVKAVDTTAKTVTLADSTVLKIVMGSEIEGGSGDEEDHVPFANEISTLADVQAALTAGKTVTAHGRGVLASSSPRTFVVIEVRFFAGTM